MTEENKARYSIVRVDDTCPSGHDGCKVNLVCVQDRKNIKERWCKNCLYGDTKEQLISKVEQIIRRPIQKGDLELKSKGFKYGVRRIAKEIVEFLGVE